MVEYLTDADLPKSSFESCGSTAALSSTSSHSHACGGTGSDKSSSFSCCSSSSNTSSDRTSGSSTRRSSWERGVVGSNNMHAPPISTITSKPHKAHDEAWAAIQSMKLPEVQSHHQHRPLQQHHSSLGITSFRVIRRLGHGDIGSVFLAQLRGHECLFAIKVMDKDALSKRNKLQRMHTERAILESVDHPFLPTLYAHFETEQFSCLVMEYCPGGDLHALRQGPSGKRFGIKAARFYAAEVLLAMEYLHMLGIVYRDLKPENVLVRDDGHIMLTDFDLCLKCDVKPTVLKSTVPLSVSPSATTSSESIPSSLLSSSSGRRRLLRSFSQSSSSSTTSFLQHGSAVNCMVPAACSIHPIMSCLSLVHKHNQKKQQAGSHGLKLKAFKSHRLSTSSTSDCPLGQFDSVSEHGSSRFTFKHDVGNRSRRSSQSATIVPNITSEEGQEGLAGNPSKRDSSQEEVMILELIAEPTQARSMSFVGTHEYLAPEMIAGQGHGSAVDWWTFGIFLYELLYGRTPFKGATNDQTLINILRQELKFPDWGAMEVGEDAKSLIQGLLNKDPKRRLGSIKGAAEIKQHPFFKGINWALIRCTKPPEVPKTIKYRCQSHEDYRHHHNHPHQQQHQRHHHHLHHQNSKTKIFTYTRTTSKPLPHFEYF